MQSKKEKRQISIAFKTYEMLLQKGVDGFSLNNLLDENSMSKGNFYHYFKNKDELFCKTLKVAYEDIASKYKLNTSLETFEEKLCELFFLYLSKDKDIIDYLSIINQMYYLYSNPKNTYLYSYMQDAYAYTFYELENIMKKEISSKLIKKEILQMVKPICATADGMLTHSFMLKNYNLEEELRNYFNFIYLQYKEK